MKNKKAVMVDIISCLFIVLFVYAALSKLLDFQNFTAQLGRSPMLAGFTGWFWLIPLIEIGISICLAIPRLQLAGLYAAFSLMTMFSSYIVTILGFSEYVPCSCGGILQKMSWSTHLWFNIIFVGLACWAIILSPRSRMQTVNAQS